MSTDTYRVYILASRPNGTLYIGITRDLRTRLEQHRSDRGSEFVTCSFTTRRLHRP